MQSPPVQLEDMTSFPTQNFPPFVGEGFVQVLLFWCLQSGPQIDQVDHVDQRPSTAEKYKKKIHKISSARILLRFTSNIICFKSLANLNNFDLNLHTFS